MIDPSQSLWESWLQKWFVRLLVPAILINAGSLLIPILEPDGALYATISKTIAQTGDYINLRVEGKDWLDKPHFPFWMAALSMRVVGINGFAYKLPALLFWAMGAWYTYRFASSLYGKPVARLSVLVYVSAAHLVISNNDVRAEPYLTGLVIGSVYHFYKVSRGGGRWTDLLLGSLLASCAMMTKGPFVLITIGAGFVIDWITCKQWRQFLDIRWWVALLLITAGILPELYCLYTQFDLHPEKLVFGRTGVSGIRFFFWDSQFGRFFNTGPIRGAGDPFFYFHTILWAFLPWSLLLYAAVIQQSGTIRSKRMPGGAICLGTTVISFLIFSLSRFQLPHYLNLLFPFFSILTAVWLYQLRRRTGKRITVCIQTVISIVLPVLVLGIAWWGRFDGWSIVMAATVLLTAALWWFVQGMSLQAVTARSFWMALLTYAFINFFLYPAILRYQAGTQAGRFMERVGREPVYMAYEGPANYSFEFYHNGPVLRVRADSIPGLTAGGPIWMFLPPGWSDSLTRKGRQVELVQRFPNFHISQLTGEYIDHRTRARTLEEYRLAKVR